MTYVVTEKCVDCVFTSCVAVCPVDAFHELPDRLYINPETCIDCNACVDECPVEAIYPDIDVPEELQEWIELNEDVAVVGITKHATEMLGDIVFVEVPENGKSVEANDQTAVVESTKAASDVYSPISGKIIEGNQKIVDDPSKVNSDPEGGGWFFKLKLKNGVM